jgi:hypothetical protein
MTYQGTRAAAEQGESKRVFVVSKVRLGANGRVDDVLWVEVNARSNLDVGQPVVASVSEVVDAIHDGARVVAVFPDTCGNEPEHDFEVVEHPDSDETIGLINASASRYSGRPGLREMAALDD